MIVVPALYLRFGAIGRTLENGEVPERLAVA